MKSLILNPYTKENQLDAIECVIKDIKMDPYTMYGLCWYFRQYHMYSGGEYIHYNELPILFPDIFNTNFAKEKLSKNVGFWWTGKNAYRNRIRYLQNCKKKLNETTT